MSPNAMNKAAAPDFSLMTYNILAAAYIKCLFQTNASLLFHQNKQVDIRLDRTSRFNGNEKPILGN